MVYEYETGHEMGKQKRSRPPETDTRKQRTLEKIPFRIILALSFLIAVSCHSADNPKAAVNDGYIKASDNIELYYQITAQYTPRTFGDWNYTTGMDHVHTPLLVIHGERDTLGFYSQNAWASALPNGHVITIPNAGKAAITDQPELVVPAIIDFLADETL